MNRLSEVAKRFRERRKASRVGIVGLVVALLAFAGAALAPWVVEALEPQRKPFDEVVVDGALKIKDRFIAKIKGEAFAEAPEPQRWSWANAYPAFVVAAAVLAMALGIVDFVRAGDARLNGATVTVGLAAIILQYFVVVAVLLLLFLLVGFVLTLLGIDL